MSTRVGFFIVIGILAGLAVFQFMFHAAGVGVIAGATAGLLLALYLDARDRRSS